MKDAGIEAKDSIAGNERAVRNRPAVQSSSFSLQGKKHNLKKHNLKVEL
jgi:hypothetical protein